MFLNHSAAHKQKAVLVLWIITTNTRCCWISLEGSPPATLQWITPHLLVSTQIILMYLRTSSLTYSQFVSPVNAGTWMPKMQKPEGKFPPALGTKTAGFLKPISRLHFFECCHIKEKQLSVRRWSIRHAINWQTNWTGLLEVCSANSLLSASFNLTYITSKS